MRKVSHLKIEEERELLIKSRNGDINSTSRLCEYMEPVVIFHSKKFSKIYPHLEDDIKQSARLGVLNAIHKFNMDKGTRLSTYVAVSVYNHILDYLREMGDVLQGLESKLNKMWNLYSGMSPERISELFNISINLAQYIKNKIMIIRRCGSLTFNAKQSYLESFEYEEVYGFDRLKDKRGFTDIEMKVLDLILDGKNEQQIEYELDILFGLGKIMKSIRIKLKGG